MKKRWRMALPVIGLSALLVLLAVPALASVQGEWEPDYEVVLPVGGGSSWIGWTTQPLTLPKSLGVIQAEAFEGTGFNTIYVSDGTKRIESRAFANLDGMSLRLPASVEYIAEDAFENTHFRQGCSAPEGSYAYDWLVEHGFIGSRNWIKLQVHGEDLDTGSPLSDLQISVFGRKADEDSYNMIDLLVTDAQGDADATYHCYNASGYTKRYDYLKLSAYLGGYVEESEEFEITSGSGAWQVTFQLEQQPIEVYTDEQYLSMLRSWGTGKRYKLMNDFVHPMTVSYWEGILDGNGHRISMKNITSLSSVMESYNGLWARENNGTIRNVTFTDINWTESSSYSDQHFGLIGANFGRISNCVVKNGAIYLTETGGIHVGALVGINSGGANIENCVNCASVRAVTNSVYVQGSGTISASEFAGGIVGLNYGTVEACLNKGSISAGMSSGSSFYATSVFGIAGQNPSGEVKGSANAGSISLLYYSASYSGTESKVFTGQIAGGTIKDCYSLYESGSNLKQVTSQELAQMWPQAY